MEHDIPYVCIPAGTRNHLALDLGLDREDPRAAMAAFAEIVERDEYRDAKVETTLDVLPDLLGRNAEPFDLQLTLPDGTEVDGAYVIQVSNNPYLDSSLLQFGERPRLDTGKLGVTALWEGSNVTMAEIIAAAATRRLDQTGALASIECTEIEVRSRSGTALVGVDGEAPEMETPLEFRIHAGSLRLLVPPGNIEAAHDRAPGSVTLNRLPCRSDRRARTGVLDGPRRFGLADAAAQPDGRQASGQGDRLGPVSVAVDGRADAPSGGEQIDTLRAPPPPSDPGSRPVRRRWRSIPRGHPEAMRGRSLAGRAPRSVGRRSAA